MKEAAEGVTGLKVNYYVLIDLQGFRAADRRDGRHPADRADRGCRSAAGRPRCPGYIEPGAQRLDGYHALWYARSRHGASDYDRMARQRCVMDAMLHQFDPKTALENFQAVAAAGKQVVSTDIPAGELPTFIRLATQTKKRQVSSMQFVPPLVHPAYPDYEVIHAAVRTAVAEARTTTDTPRGAAGAAARPASSTSAAPGASGSHGAVTPEGSGTARPAASGDVPGGSGATAAASAVDMSAVCSSGG